MSPDAAKDNSIAARWWNCRGLFLLPSLWLLFRVFKADLPGVAEVDAGAAER